MSANRVTERSLDLPIFPLIKMGVKRGLKYLLGRLAQLVRASRLHREGRRFESCNVHQQKHTKILACFCWCAGEDSAAPHLGFRLDGLATASPSRLTSKSAGYGSGVLVLTRAKLLARFPLQQKNCSLSSSFVGGGRCRIRTCDLLGVNETL